MTVRSEVSARSRGMCEVQHDVIHALTYGNDDGEVIEVVVPWGHRSGRIPPPFITFSGVTFTYWYTGPERRPS